MNVVLNKSVRFLAVTKLLFYSLTPPNLMKIASIDFL